MAYFGWAQWLAVGIGLLAVHCQVSWASRAAIRGARSSSGPALGATAFSVSALDGLLGLLGPMPMGGLGPPYGDRKAHHLALSWAECLADVGVGLLTFTTCALVAACLGRGTQDDREHGSLSTAVRGATASLLALAVMFLMVTADFNGPLGSIEVLTGPGLNTMHPTCGEDMYGSRPQLRVRIAPHGVSWRLRPQSDWGEAWNGAQSIRSLRKEIGRAKELHPRLRLVCVSVADGVRFERLIAILDAIAASLPNIVLVDAGTGFAPAEHPTRGWPWHPETRPEGPMPGSPSEGRFPSTPFAD